MKNLILCLLLGMTVSAHAQNFDIADFNEKLAEAEWLVAYDQVAWWTTDSIMVQSQEELARLGSDWFCYQADGAWHAVYGKYENNEFDLVFHYIVKAADDIERSYEPVDTALLHSYSRALGIAANSIIGLRDSVTLRFNQYIKRNADKTISLWILPAFQPDAYAIYGGEFIFTLDETGQKILSTNHYYKGDFYGMKANREEEFWINYEELEKPTLGGVFFATYYAPYFKKVVLLTKNSRSMPFYMNDEWTWIHADIEKPKKSKKRKRKN